jgi:hypothetical protein
MSHKKKQQSIEEKKFENKTSSIPAADLIKQKTSEILTENPVDKILDKSKEIVQEEPKTLAFYFDYKIWVFIIIAIILSLSISLNTLFFKKIDLKFFAGVTLVEDFFINHLEKPFVVTIGEFKTVEEAKSEAVRLLPVLKQINIELLDNGYYVFVIDKLSSKKRAYEFANELRNKNPSSVKVRYLRKSKFVNSK